MSKRTNGAWRAHGPDEFGDYTVSPVGEVLAVAAVVSNMRLPAEVAANAALVAAAPDHAMLAQAMCLGLARWEPFEHDATRGEVCVGGLRWASRKDQFGVPELHGSIRSALGLAITGAGW